MNSAKLIKSSSLYLVGNIANRAVGFLMIPLYTRFLSPADYGTIELVDLTISLIVITLGYAAIGASMIRIYHDWQDDQDRSVVVSSSILTLAVLGVFVTAGAMLGAPAICQALFHSTANISFIRTCFIATYVGNLVELALAYQRLKNRAMFFVGYSLIQLVGMVGLNTYFIAYAHNGIWSFVLSRLIVTTLGGIFLIFVVLKEVGLKWRFEPVRRMLVFGSPLILSAVCFFIIHFSDRFFLSKYSTLTELGIYSLAYKFGFLITFLVGQPFGRAWNVTLYEYAETAGWKENFARVVRYLVFFLFLVSMGIVLFARELLTIMATPPFRPAVLVIPVVIAAYVFRETGEFFRNVLYIIKERSRRVSILTIFCALLNIGLNFLLIPKHGIMGAAWATLFTWVVYMVLVWVAAYQDHRFPYSAWSFLLLTVISLPVWYLGRLSGGLPTLGRWAADGLLLTAFAGMAIAFGYFPRNDLLTLRHHAMRLVAKLRDSKKVETVPL